MTAARLFAFELARLDPEARADGAPVSPTGALCQRIFTVGLLTSVEKEGGAHLGHLSDLTGEVVLSATAREPAAALFLGNAQVPALAAATARWTPQGWRAEEILDSTEAARNRWVVETGARTLERIERMRQALASGRRASENHAIQEAIRHYRPTHSALDELEEETTSAIRIVAGGADGERVVLDLLVKLDGGGGVPRGTLLQEATRAGIGRGEAERALTALLEEGRCFEPRIGVLRAVGR